MKAALNGVLNFSVLDGWWIEGYRKNPNAGWAIGKFPEEYQENEKLNDWERDANEIYDILEKQIIPSYMNHDEWLFKCKNAISLAAYFNTHRMVEEYAEKAYDMKRRPRWDCII